MATTIHDVISEGLQPVGQSGSTFRYIYDVGSGQQTRSFYQVILSSLGSISADIYVQAPTNTSDRTANLILKGGGFGRKIELKTDASTPIQVPFGQSLIVVISNLEATAQNVSGWINGNF